MSERLKAFKKKDGEIRLSGDNISMLHYEWDQDSGSWYIDEFMASSDNKGIGTALARCFVETIGYNQRVWSDIRDDSSKDVIRSFMEETDVLEITDPKILDRIRISHIANKCGIRTECIIAKYADPEESGYRYDEVLEMTSLGNPDVKDGKVFMATWVGTT